MRPLRATLLLLCLACIASAHADAPAEDILIRHPEARLLILGEYHGTVEAPALMLALAGQAAKTGPVTVALEIWSGEQARIEAFLATAGSAADRRELLRGPFWQVPPERSDGRRSQAMLALLEGLRILRRDHPRLAVVAFDDRDAALPGDDSHRRLAEALRRLHAERGETRILVLAGNYHARLAPPADLRDEQGRPMRDPPVPTAAHLRDLDPVVIEVVARGGSAWSFGEKRLMDAPTWPLGLRDLEPARDGFHGRLVLPRLSASPPVSPEPALTR